VITDEKNPSSYPQVIHQAIHRHVSYRDVCIADVISLQIH